MFRVLRQKVHSRTKACRCALATGVDANAGLTVWLWDHELNGVACRAANTGLIYVGVFGIDLVCDRFCGQHIAILDETKVEMRTGVPLFASVQRRILCGTAEANARTASRLPTSRPPDTRSDRSSAAMQCLYLLISNHWAAHLESPGPVQPAQVGVGSSKCAAFDLDQPAECHPRSLNTSGSSCMPLAVLDL
jgi:hypothetical protein